ncbi:hypothetical protein FHK98_11515, partial [Cylindrospermopsis raciborskii CS-506_A]|nr:hypothetical protein [Cylindrospermopsis raciborskii CS-506_A]
MKLYLVNCDVSINAGEETGGSGVGFGANASWVVSGVVSTDGETGGSGVGFGATASWVVSGVVSTGGETGG